ncbi:MAG: hypothetical protein ACQEWW_07805 [Bacillota bacterium]
MISRKKARQNALSESMKANPTRYKKPCKIHLHSNVNEILLLSLGDTFRLLNDIGVEKELPVNERTVRTFKGKQYKVSYSTGVTEIEEGNHAYCQVWLSDVNGNLLYDENEMFLIV